MVALLLFKVEMNLWSQGTCSHTAVKMQLGVIDRMWTPVNTGVPETKMHRGRLFYSSQGHEIVRDCIVILVICYYSTLEFVLSSQGFLVLQCNMRCNM